MPELPEVETTRKGISPYCEQQTVAKVTVRQPKLRWPVPDNLAELIEGRTIHGIQRRAKYLLLAFDNGTLMIHLGMSGSLRVMLQPEPPQKHDHVDITLVTGHTLRYHDPRKFGGFVWTEQPVAQHKLISHLGPEPLSDAFTAEYLSSRCQKRKTAIKSLIMDSKVVVGVGNIYANEALFMAGINPQQAAGKLSEGKISLLAEKIRFVLKRSIEQGGTTLKDFVGGDGKPGYFAQQLNVYGRAGQSCPECGYKLEEVRQSNRSSVFCAKCQPLT